MRSGTQRVTLTSASSKIFEIRVKELHSLLLRPNAACEVSFSAFTYGTNGLRLSANETFSLDWREFQNARASDALEIYAADGAGTTTMDIIYTAREAL